jgi:hypothetical protein
MRRKYRTLEAPSSSILEVTVIVFLCLVLSIELLKKKMFTRSFTRGSFAASPFTAFSPLLALAQ